MTSPLSHPVAGGGRTRKSLKNPVPRTPAMAAGVEDHISSVREIEGLPDS